MGALDRARYDSVATPLATGRRVLLSGGRDDAGLVDSDVVYEASNGSTTVVATGTDIAGAAFGLNEDFYVEAIRHKVRRAGFRHDVTFDLSAAAGFSDFWVLGSSTLGTATKLNY